MVDIGEVIRNGVVFNLRNWQEGPVDSDKLTKAVSRLFALLNERKIDYVLVGGVAMLQYVEGRNTQDIDLIVEVDALNKFPEAEIIDRQQDFARARFADVRLDFLFTRHPLFDLIRRQYSSVQPFEQGKIRCASVEGMLLLKLYALPSLYRQGRLDRAALYETDILMLMRRADASLAEIFGVLKPHLSESDLTEVRKITDEIRGRLGRSGENFGAEK